MLKYTEKEKKTLAASRKKFSLSRGREEEEEEERDDLVVKRSRSEPLMNPRDSVAEDGKENADLLQDDNGDVSEEGSLLFHEKIISSICQHYYKLLTSEEHEMIQRFKALSKAAKMVFVRLHGRKYRLFRCSEIRIKNVDNIGKLDKRILIM